jgi:hypothetical protein
MHQHTQLNSFENPQEVSIEVQQKLEAKKSQIQSNYTPVKLTFLEDTTQVHSH